MRSPVLRLLLAPIPRRLRSSVFEPAYEDLRLDRAASRGGSGKRHTFAVAALIWQTYLVFIAAGLKSCATEGPRSCATAFAQDGRYAIRMMANKPLFAFVSIASLALGIGANVAVFGLANAMLVQRLSIPDPHHVVRLYPFARHSGIFSFPTFDRIRQHARVFTAIAGHAYADVRLGEGAGGIDVTAEVVTGEYFAVMAVPPALGRSLTPADTLTKGGHPVAVISDRVWESRFARDPAVIGSALIVNGHRFEVVGVMPPAFTGSYGAWTSDMWAPISMYEQVRPVRLDMNRATWEWLRVTGRLRPGVSPDQAQADLIRVASLLPFKDAGLGEPYRLHLVAASRVPEDSIAGIGRVMTFAAGVTFLVLLVTCANVAGMLQARLADRRREIAVRRSLGASRGRLVQQWLTESLVLATAAGAAALVMARWMQNGILALRPPLESFAGFDESPRADLMVVGFTGLVVLLTALLCGALPALLAARGGVSAVLQEESGTAAGGRHRSRVRAALVVGQVAISLVLLTVGSLMMRTLRNTETFDTGFRTENLLLGKLQLERHDFSPEQARLFYARLLERLDRTPGVAGATTAMVVPLGFDEETRGYAIPGWKPPQGRAYFSIDTNIVDAAYFRVMGIPIVRGRAFDARDRLGAPAGAIIVNETMARRFWDGRNPVGERLQIGPDRAVEIIGVARDIKYRSISEEPRPYVYMPATQQFWPDMYLHVRVLSDRESVLRAIGNLLAEMDPRVSIRNAVSFEQLRRVSLFPKVIMATVGTIFGALSVILTCIGVYGIVSASVATRTREIGVRMAFGASPGQMLRAVVGEGLSLTVTGVILGIGIALLVTPLLRAQLFGVAPGDPVTYALVAVVLLAVTAIAAWAPARRAARIDPAAALRTN